MPITSYLASPARGEVERLTRDLEALPGCTVLPSDDREVLVVVTETDDDAADEALSERLRAHPGLDALVLVSAFRTDTLEPS
jgi:nitrate reductase NapAB chaperone NapD